MSCPAPQLASRKTKRSRFSQKHRSDGIKLADALNQYLKEYPGFADHLSACIVRIIEDAERTRQSDRDKVLNALRQWPSGLGWKDIMDDTGMSRWDVRQILYDLMEKGIVEETTEPLPEMRSVWWRRIYRIKPNSHSKRKGF